MPFDSGCVTMSGRVHRNFEILLDLSERTMIVFNQFTYVPPNFYYKFPARLTVSLLPIFAREPYSQVFAYLAVELYDLAILNSRKKREQCHEHIHKYNCPVFRTINIPYILKKKLRLTN